MFGLSLSGGSSGGNGGCVRFGDAYDATFSDVTFSSCSATGQGGGVYAIRDVEIKPSQLVFTNCSFVNNTAGGAGGGLYVDGVNVEMSSVTFDSNQAGKSGGGFFGLALRWRSRTST